MNSGEQFIQKRLQSRIEGGFLRELATIHLPVDFCSNDYLGFAKSENLKSAIDTSLSETWMRRNGSGGSRLLSGNSAFTEETEAFIAKFHQAEAGLIFNSGYDANLGLLSSLAQRGDTIISDEYIHASLIDGARLTHASRYTFRHNDLQDLEAKLKIAKGNAYVVIESVYSMDGDIAPIKAISMLCKQYQANLIVDEAHAIGIFGHHGKGLVQQETLQDEVFARVVTFGKALGCHGAIVLGSHILRQYLINFARSFIYTTSAPIHQIVSVKCAYDLLIAKNYIPLIEARINSYREAILASGLDDKAANPTAIQVIKCHGNAKAKRLANTLQQKGMDVRAILSPTVREGQERLRICLHTYNTDEEIKTLLWEIANLSHHE